MKKQHKWLGIVFSFFILMFCVSGIVLNHRAAISGIDVDRGFLPGRYRFSRWNSGLMRATVLYRDRDSVENVLVYGTGGIFKTDREASFFSDFNHGLPKGIDRRQMRSVVQTRQGDLFAVSNFGLFRYVGDDDGWQYIELPKDDEEMLSDAVCRGDTLVVGGRSNIYAAVAPYRDFTRIQLKMPEDHNGKVSLFRTVWMLHSGELFGMTGRVAVDSIAIVLIFLCLSGLAYWQLAKYAGHRLRNGHKAQHALNLTRLSISWHDKIGRVTIVFTIFIALTGWCLRPPLMVPLALTKTAALPGSALDSDNPWHDKLRMIRYDGKFGDWLISTSDGFYSVKNLNDVPERLKGCPPVSVMGLNVFERNRWGLWICGSFSGLFIWDREKGYSTDYFTNDKVTDTAGPPFGKRAISGFGSHFNMAPFPVDYYNGTDAIAQPEWMATLPISLWHLALEVHSGRIYIGSIATYIFIFFTGACLIWCLWSGWKLRRRR